MRGISLLAVSLLSASVLVGLPFLLACEDQDKKKAELIAKAGGSATAVAAPSTVPTIAPAASSAPVAAKPPKECAPGPDVTVDDPEVDAEIRAKAKKPTGPLTAKDLASVTSIRINQRKTPLPEIDPCVFPKMVALKFLYLPKGTYSDLTPVANLTKLEGLFAPDNEIQDLKPLEKLLLLDQLVLTHTQVRDITTLGNLVNLTELTLDDTQVSDISVLAKCTKLEKLSLKNTLVKDVSPLKELKKLKTLNVQGTALTNLDTLDPLKARGLKIQIN
jgi:hypothetical protein